MNNQEIMMSNQEIYAAIKAAKDSYECGEWGLYQSLNMDELSMVDEISDPVEKAAMLTVILQGVWMDEGWYFRFATPSTRDCISAFPAVYDAIVNDGSIPVHLQEDGGYALYTFYIVEGECFFTRRHFMAPEIKGAKVRKGVA